MTVPVQTVLPDSRLAPAAVRQKFNSHSLAGLGDNTCSTLSDGSYYCYDNTTGVYNSGLTNDMNNPAAGGSSGGGSSSGSGFNWGSFFGGLFSAGAKIGQSALAQPCTIGTSYYSACPVAPGSGGSLPVTAGAISPNILLMGAGVLLLVFVMSRR